MTTPPIGSRHVPRPRAGRGEQPVTVVQVHRPDRAVTVERDDGTKAVVKLAELKRKWQRDHGDGAPLEPRLEAELARINAGHPPELARAQAGAMADAVRMARRLTLAQRDAIYRIANGAESGYAITVVRPLVALRLAFARPDGRIELTAAGGDVLRALEHGA